jgi:hypothetical protein
MRSIWCAILVALGCATLDAAQAQDISAFAGKTFFNPSGKLVKRCVYVSPSGSVYENNVVEGRNANTGTEYKIGATITFTQPGGRSGTATALIRRGVLIMNGHMHAMPPAAKNKYSTPSSLDRGYDLPTRTIEVRGDTCRTTFGGETVPCKVISGNHLPDCEQL